MVTFSMRTCRPASLRLARRLKDLLKMSYRATAGGGLGGGGASTTAGGMVAVPPVFASKV